MKMFFFLKIEGQGVRKMSKIYTALLIFFIFFQKSPRETILASGGNDFKVVEKLVGVGASPHYR
jgi:hypothetical protein